MVLAALRDGARDRIAQKRQIVRMDLRPCFAHPAPGAAEYRLQVGREAQRAALDMPVPYRHARGNQAILQAFLAIAHRGFRSLDLSPPPLSPPLPPPPPPPPPSSPPARPPRPPPRRAPVGSDQGRPAVA